MIAETLYRGDKLKQFFLRNTFGCRYCLDTEYTLGECSGFIEYYGVYLGYGIGRKIDIRRCEREQFTKLHTGIKQKLQSSVCSWIIYQGNEVVVLIERLEEEKTIVTTFRNYAEVKKAWMEDYTVARVTTGINTEKTDILISVGNFGFA